MTQDERYLAIKKLQKKLIKTLEYVRHKYIFSIVKSTNHIIIKSKEDEDNIIITGVMARDIVSFTNEHNLEFYIHPLGTQIVVSIYIK